MAFDAFLGKEVSEASVRIGIRIPDELALLCGDLDEAAHGDAATSLSGIDLNRHRIGYEAAVLLGKLLAGHKPRAPILIPPRGIQANRSTDALVFSDPVLLEALRFIRAKSGDPIQVSDIVDHVMVSRRLLESRFRDTLKRSPAAEIRRVRLDRSRRLLDGGLSVNDTAACSGFRYPEVFSRAFRREFGVSPSDYRLPGSQGR
jgi:LacI family transcriptional regulator